MLAFAPHLDVIRGRAGLIATADDGCELYGGRHFATVARLLDGVRTRQEIIDACPGEQRPEVASAISELLRDGVIVESAPGLANRDRRAAWWSSQAIAPDRAAARLASASVRVYALGGVDPSPTIEALDRAGVAVEAAAEIGLVLVEDYLDDRLEQVNAEALEAGLPWWLAAPTGAEILIGPVFMPGRGPCWQCLAHRLRRLRSTENGLRRALAGGRPAPVRVRRPVFLEGLGPMLVAAEVAGWIAGARQGAETTVASFDARSWESGRHQVGWRPQCRACGEPDASLARSAAPIVPEPSASEAAVPIARDSLRTVGPDVTMRRFEHLVSPVTGAVPGLTRLMGPAHRHVYVSSDLGVVEHGDRDAWRRRVGVDWLGLLANSAAGKGTTDEAARSSALGEALERFCSRFGGEEPRRTASFEQLGDEAIPPNDDLHYSERQYAERDRWNAEVHRFRTRVPEPFDLRAEIDWSPVWSLTHQRERLLPTALCYSAARDAGRRFCVADSNGNSAGNTAEEAILHGLLELIERDQVALWWYNRHPAPPIDLNTIGDPWLAQVRADVDAQGRELWALDLTADLGIPVAAALLSSEDGSRFGVGLGAHFDLGRAIVRAVTELVQLGLAEEPKGLRDRVRHPPLPREQYGFACPGPEAPRRAVEQAVAVPSDVTTAVERCRSAIEAQGVEVLVLDLTRPDIGLPVVKVIAPELRHPWPRFAPGRLYDVPVALGWRERPCAEDEFDPMPPAP